MTLTIHPHPSQEQAQILNAQALELVEALEKQFGERRKALLARRDERQQKLDQGATLDFLPETRSIRDGDWKVADIPADIQDRRVEITGPVDRKMIINALNSGAKVFMADFEDAHSPTWAGTVQGQQNLYDALRKTITFTSEEGKDYRLNDETAILMVRVRGLHMVERHVQLEGKPVSAAFFDLAVYLCNNHQYARDNGIGLYFYIPKTESHHEAELWAEVFAACEQFLQIPHGTIRCTVLIETVTAAFEMDEILYALKDYIVALNAGRWDYIFNFIKRFKSHHDKILPERAQVTMTTHFMRSYSQLLIQTCHKRGAFAMGGMAAQIPIKNDEAKNREAFAKVKADKEREVHDGHDGTWVAHPGLVPVAMEVFDTHMPEPNQVNKSLPVDKQSFSAADLLKIPDGTITDAGVKTNVAAALRYMMAWLLGQGAVPIFNLMEDAATAEISRAQLWQWIRAKVSTVEGNAITEASIRRAIADEVEELQQSLNEAQKQALDKAAKLLIDLVVADEFVEFLTLPAYELLED